MIVYRIAKSIRRVNDLSGTGAFKDGGRWNNPGTYMLYTSENSSLAYLESLVHCETENMPPDLHVMSINLDIDAALIYELPDSVYPKNWQKIGCIENKVIGSNLMDTQKYIAVKVRSAINSFEYNYLLNPLFPRYHDYISVSLVQHLNLDVRLVNQQFGTDLQAVSTAPKLF